MLTFNVAVFLFSSAAVMFAVQAASTGETAETYAEVAPAGVAEVEEAPVEIAEVPSSLSFVSEETSGKSNLEG